MTWRGVFTIAMFVVGLHASHVRAGTEVAGWDLRTRTTDSSTGTGITSFFNISTVTNPLQQNTASQVGLNSTTADYDYSWLMDSVPATFNTSLTQTFRTSDIREVSNASIGFVLSHDAVFNINSMLHYSHTPLDENRVFWQVAMFNVTTQQLVFNHVFHGGYGSLLPPSGTFSINESHLLRAGDGYSFSYTLDSTNASDLGQTGTMDISGFVHANLTPEPSSLMLAAVLIGPIAARRRRRRQ